MESPDTPFKIKASPVDPNSDHIILNLSYPDDETLASGDLFINEAVNKVANGVLNINIIHDDVPTIPLGHERTYEIQGSSDQLKSVLEYLGISKNIHAININKAKEAKDLWGSDPKNIPEDKRWW